MVTILTIWPFALLAAFGVYVVLVGSRWGPAKRTD